MPATQYIAALLLLTASQWHAQSHARSSIQCNVVEGHATLAKNADGSTLRVKTTQCGDVIAQQEVIHEFRGRVITLIKTPFKTKSGPGRARLFDFNNDGMYEIEISQACGMVNCENTIYTFDRRTLKPTQAYHYFGYGGVILGDYFIATIRTAGYGQYTHEAFRVISHSKLKIENKSSFTVLSDFDQELGKPVCHFSLKEKFRSSALVKQIATEMCFPGALVKMDMH